MKNILVTGANGFIGKNIIAELNLNQDVSIIPFTRNDSLADLEIAIQKADFIFHLAGENRPINESDFRKNNTELTEFILSVLKKSNKKTPLLLSSSVQAELNNPYGLSKRAAEDAVFAWHSESNSPVYVYRLPGVFGKWAKPNYNSVVATFCNNIANDLPITINDPEYTVTLAYIDDVVRVFKAHLEDSNTTSDFGKILSISSTFELTLSDLSERIMAIHNIRTSLVIPDLNDLLNKYLYASYISYLKTDNFSYTLLKNSDDRGWLSEFVKSKNFGQIFISKTKPGVTRGDHWHHTKIEKFLVISGKGEIAFRNKHNNDTEIIRYNVEGDEMKVLDIPVGYVHSIKNVGDDDLITLFWANELLNKTYPDTHYEKVIQEKPGNE